MTDPAATSTYVYNANNSQRICVRQWKSNAMVRSERTMGTAALGVGATTLSATSVEAWALASFSGPLGSAAGIVFKGLTGQDVGASDAVGALTNMIPLPSALPL